ncbi:hypothetical protein PAXRUDRAFT_531059 [Paxillus rubicundulus Ve08.2h10]|uniref:Uncharacterized protein n=1 Tax=Paxillus rubicundulus Ve08.2h10 TaxID=930991 RepID=A0A0D0D865_9AGAM|nr:hypothetical protein PAXRUDRAFT_531059 [Paxillus rubicundulus Ve08.2h10]
MSIEIAPPTNPGPLPKSTPSLMPFHISYTGPAPISRYFRTKPTPPSIPSTSTRAASLATLMESQITTSETQRSLRSLGPMVGNSTSTTAVNNFLDDNGERVSRQASGDNMGMNVDTETQSVSLGLTDTAQGPLDDAISLGPAPSNPERVVAAFRGRQMYGQVVGMPEGYGGLVLRAPSLDGKGQGKEDVKATFKPASKRATGNAKTRMKFTRSTRQSKRASRTEENDDDEDDEAQERGDYGSHLAEPPAPIRKLIPTSSFSSFTLWTPDIPVDEGRDEYVRALAEWTKLAAEIHSYDE